MSATQSGRILALLELVDEAPEVSELDGYLTDPDPEVRRTALSVLSEAADDWAEASPLIAAALLDGEAAVRRRAADLLGELREVIEPGPAFEAGLRAALDHPEAEIRVAALGALWRHRLTRPAELAALLRDGDERVRREAVLGMVSLDDLDGLASLIMACDIVITISGVVAHLCGALGHSGWVLLPRRVSRLWYWRHHREDSPWYPSLKLCSQAQHGDWSGVMRVVRERLHRMLASRR
jgi:hypothetical protein